MNKYYYDEAYTNDLITKYQGLVETIEDEKGHKIVVNKTPEIEQLETLIVNEIQKVVKAIIFNYRYQQWYEYDDLFSIGVMACWTNVLKFTPGKGSSFNFFSLITKKCLYGITTRHQNKQKKIVYLEDLGDAVHAPQEANIDEFIDSLESTIREIIDYNFLDKKRAKYHSILKTMCEYFRINKAYLSKSDVYKFCGDYGIKTADIRAFVKDIKPYYNELADLVELKELDTVAMVEADSDSGELDE